MAQQEVHFEIFTRQGAKGGWKLHDVMSQRDAAMKMAQNLMTEGGATGVKVVKETYNSDTGDYLTLKIFEDGHNQAKVEPAAEDVPNALPCFKPDDLYSYHARATMARLLGDYLARQKLTVTELIHRADALEKFEATGTVYQHAIQKIAVAQAASTKMPVQQIIKDLNELVTKAINRVYRDERRNHFPGPQARKGPGPGGQAGHGGRRRLCAERRDRQISGRGQGLGRQTDSPAHHPRAKQGFKAPAPICCAMPWTG